MKIAYFDCSSGISGDMCLGALVSAGASLKKIKGELAKLPLKGYRLSAKRVRRSGIEALKIDVITKGSSQPIRWSNAQSIIKDSALDADIKASVLRIIKSIFIAEAIAHGEPYDRIHLHELGSPDAFIDIVGTVSALKELGVQRVYASAVNLGGGFVLSAHGRLPVPAPATIELLKGFSIYSEGEKELTTPTGAALLKGLAQKSGNIPSMRLETVGVGAGAADIRGFPNILRVFIGEAVRGHAPSDESISVIETNIDDMNPQLWSHIVDKLFESGAVDVCLTQVIMKKGRPGVLLTVLCPGHRVRALSDIIFSETSTLGVRYYEAGRITLMRKTERVQTEFGSVRVKTALSEGRALKSAPEFEDMRRLAQRHGLPLIEIEKKVKKGL